MLIPMSVATNFDPALPGELARFNREGNLLKAVRVYGSLPADVVGNGRPAHWLPPIGLKELQAHVAAMAEVGIGFAYTLNAPELFGSEEDPVWRDRLDALLQDLRHAGVTRLVVANRWLLRYLRDRRQFACTLSLVRGVASPEDAVEAEALGVDEICVHGHKVNRNLELIARIRGATRLPLELNANMACLTDCQQAHDHYRMEGYLSRADLLLAHKDMAAVDPFVMQCSLRQLSDPTLFVRNALVPPGYLRTYVAAGIDRFKITDRASSTESLLSTLRAYATDEPAADLYPAVLKRGSKLKLGLRGIFPDDFICRLRVPQFRIDGRRFVEERFIERQASLSEQASRGLAESLIEVEDPEYLERFLAFCRAVSKKVAGRNFIPRSELSGFHALMSLLEPSAVIPRSLPLALPLARCRAALADRVGGKNASLGELMGAGFPVPPGFAVTTEAFALFVEQSGLERLLREALSGLEAGRVEALEAASRTIREAMRATPIPPQVGEVVAEAYRELSRTLGRPDAPVAVRSSATSEDQRAASFAGQLESFLCVRGLEAVLRNLRECWASLFTARALSYSLRLGLRPELARVSVGIQAMVEAEAAGVMFTLNPLNGDRSKIVIEASWGLGESVVKGDVTPDSYVVDKVTLEVVKRSISDKAECRRAGGERDCVERVEVVPEKRRAPCLAEETVLALARLGKRVERHYGVPQDIEWAVDPTRTSPDNIFILQSRPETVWSNQERTPIRAATPDVLELILEELTRGEK
jgi:pyruvate,water dikinase